MRKTITALLIAISLMIAAFPCVPMAETNQNDNGGVSEETVEEPINGWVKENGKRYYYINGVMQKGFVSIDGTKYYFNKNGEAAPKGWIDGKKMYYSQGKGVVATKPIKIGKSVYMFRTNGKLKKKKGLFKYKGKEYYGRGDGRLKVGWVIIKEKRKEKAVYFNKSNGSMVKGGKVGYLKIPKNGRLGEAYVLGIRFLDKHGWNLKKAFYAVVKSTKYGLHDLKRKNVEGYAKYGFKNQVGNCYVFNAEVFICAKLLGYNVTQWDGFVNIRDNPHSWCTIKKKDGTVLIYDASFEDHGRRKDSPHGFALKEKTKGSWRYMPKRKVLKSDSRK